jgi:hypothetical protein
MRDKDGTWEWCERLQLLSLMQSMPRQPRDWTADVMTDAMRDAYNDWWDTILRIEESDPAGRRKANDRGADDYLDRPRGL